MYWDQWVSFDRLRLQWSHQRRQRDGTLCSAARGDPLYEVGVGIGRLLRTVFLADYFVKPPSDESYCACSIAGEGPMP